MTLTQPRLIADAPEDENRDDATAPYVLAIQPGFHMLRHAAAQLAAFLVLAVSGSNVAAPDHKLVQGARRAWQEAEEIIRGVPADRPEVKHHHRHLRRALVDIGAAAAQLGNALIQDETELERALQRLKAGWQELQWSTAALPGFEIVALGQACCAGHSVIATRQAR
jgi:hypothetical protein